MPLTGDHADTADISLGLCPTHLPYSPSQIHTHPLPHSSWQIHMFVTDASVQVGLTNDDVDADAEYM